MNIVETKKEFTELLVTALSIPLYDGVKSIYEKAGETAKGDDVLRRYQGFLEGVKYWSENMILGETNRIKSNNNLVDLLPDLLKSTLKASITVILSSVDLPCAIIENEIVNYLDKFSFENFIYNCYLEIANELYNNPALMYDKCDVYKYKKNQLIVIELIKKSILNTLRNLLPLRQIFKYYLSKKKVHHEKSDNIRDYINNKNDVNKNDFNKNNFNKNNINKDDCDKNECKINDSQFKNFSHKNNSNSKLFEQDNIRVNIKDNIQNNSKTAIKLLNDKNITNLHASNSNNSGFIPESGLKSAPSQSKRSTSLDNKQMYSRNPEEDKKIENAKNAILHSNFDNSITSISNVNKFDSNKLDKIIEKSIIEESKSTELTATKKSSTSKTSQKRKKTKKNVFVQNKNNDDNEGNTSVYIPGNIIEAYNM